MLCRLRGGLRLGQRYVCMHEAIYPPLFPSYKSITLLPMASLLEFLIMYSCFGYTILT